jgi:hypothetical protein
MAVIFYPPRTTGGGGGGGAWGTITGTLSAQTDLQTALNAKANTAHSHAISDVTNLQTSLDAKLNVASPSSTGAFTHTGTAAASQDVNFNMDLNGRFRITNNSTGRTVGWQTAIFRQRFDAANTNQVGLAVDFDHTSGTASASNLFTILSSNIGGLHKGTVSLEYKPNATFTGSTDVRGKLSIANGGAAPVYFGSESIGTDRRFFIGSSSSAELGIVVPNGTDYDLTMPSTQGGAGTVLQNNGSGVLTWATISGGLSHFTENRNITAPNATNPVHQLIASGAESRIDIALTPKGTGALTAQIADNTTTGGNKRGLGAVDWQSVRSSNTDVASSSYSVICGGHSNAATASFSVVSGGELNRASGQYSSVIGGHSNTADGTNSSVLGGRGLTLLGNNSFGYYGNLLSTMSVNSANTGVFGNVDLWLVNNDNTVRSLRFYEQYNTAGVFPNGTNYVAFRAPNSIAADVTWTLPNADGSNGQLLQTNGAGTLSWATLGSVVVKSKTGAESVTSSTTVQDDDHLAFDIPANQTWRAKYEILLTAAGSTDARLKFTLPSGATASATGTYARASDNSTTETSDATTEFVVTISNAANSTHNALLCIYLRVVNSSTAGTVQLQWAQGTSNATSLTFRNRSGLLASRES